MISLRSCLCSSQLSLAGSCRALSEASAMLCCVSSAPGEAESAYLMWISVLLRGTYRHDACEYMVKGKVLQGSCLSSVGKWCWSRHLMLCKWFISTVTGKDVMISRCDSYELHSRKMDSSHQRADSALHFEWMNSVSSERSFWSVLQGGRGCGVPGRKGLGTFVGGVGNASIDD